MPLDRGTESLNSEKSNTARKSQIERIEFHFFPRLHTNREPQSASLSELQRVHLSLSFAAE